jgi:deazaflavin-dependent oxidoreductase (nitroreductase family)
MPLNPKDEFAKFGNVIHETIFRLTDGRLGGNLMGMPSMLTAPIVDGDKVVLVASYGGDTRHPAWFLNLRDNPEVEVVMTDRKGPMKARVATAEEKAEMWPRITSTYKGYAGYQERTDRDIPLVILEPA